MGLQHFIFVILILVNSAKSSPLPDISARRLTLSFSRTNDYGRIVDTAHIGIKLSVGDEIRKLNKLAQHLNALP